jgi:hypothetical protein
MISCELVVVGRGVDRRVLVGIWAAGRCRRSCQRVCGPKRLLEGALKHEVSGRYARFLNNATHSGFGIANGAGYGLLGSRRKPKVWFGLPFGAAVWAGGYLVLPQLGVYKPIWNYDLKTLEKDLRAHLVFGMATAAAFSLATNLEVYQ